LVQYKKETSYRWVIVAIIWFSHTVYFLNSMTVGTMAPLMKSELNLNSARIGFLVSAISIGSMLFQVPFGLFADRFGIKWVMVGGLSLVGASALLISTFNSYFPILCILVFLGAGIAANQTPGSKAIILWFSARGRATGMGIKQTGVTMGGILAPVFLPMVAQQFGSWRYSFAFAGFVVIGSAIIVALFYHDPAQDCGTVFHGKYSIRSDILQLLKNRDFLLVCFAGIFLMVAQFSLVAYLMLYATSGLRLSLGRSGFLVSLLFLGGFLGRIGWGVLSDYLLKGKRNVILIVIGVLGAITLASFIGVQQRGSVFLIYFLTILLGLTSMGWNAILLTRVGEIAGGRLAATATGISFVVTNLGAIFGPPVFGYLIDRTGAYTASWCFLTFCMILVIFFSILLKKESDFAEV